MMQVFHQVIITLALVQIVSADTTADGTHVDSYIRINPDGNPFNNFSGK